MAKRRANGEGTIYKRKDGRWEGRIIVGYREDDKAIYKISQYEVKIGEDEPIRKMVEICEELNYEKLLKVYA